MGLDYAEKVARSYRKGLDRVRVAAATPTLFVQQPECAPRSYAAEILKGQNLAVGDERCVRLDGDRVIITDGFTPVAAINNPSPDLRHALKEGRGGGATVRDVHEAARTAEVTIW
jgi:hypothetical protein